MSTQKNNMHESQPESNYKKYSVEKQKDESYDYTDISGNGWKSGFLNNNKENEEKIKMEKMLSDMKILNEDIIKLKTSILPSAILPTLVPQIIKENIESEEEINDNEEEEQEEQEVIELPPILSNETQSHIKDITTDGFMETDPIYHKLTRAELHSLGKCTYCGKFYNNDMIQNPYMTMEEFLCWHCYFWMNHDVSIREMADGPGGMTIADYILKCDEQHEQSKCVRNNDGGGCFLCEHKAGLDIPKIKDGYKVNKSEVKQLQKPVIIENNNINECQDEVKITL
jgi:hypothetical protein